MIDLGPHAEYIALSYGAAALIVAALLAWVIVDGRNQKRLLRKFEARGIKRGGDAE